MNENDLEVIGERFTRLEREVRLWKRAATATMVLLVALIAFSPPPRTREASAADSAAKDLVVRSLTIFDEHGNRRIALDSRSALVLYDEKGTLRAGLGIDKDGPALVLHDEKGAPHATLSAFGDGTVLELTDEKGTPRAGLAATSEETALLLYDEKGTQRAKLATKKDSPVLALLDDKGALRAILAATKDGPALALLDKGGKPIWRAP
jgi:hypothetical protein